MSETLYDETQTTLVVTIVTISLSGVTFYFGIYVVVLQKKMRVSQMYRVSFPRSNLWQYNMISHHFCFSFFSTCPLKNVQIK